MARIATVTIDDVDYTLQSVSPSWFYELQDDCGIGTNDRDMKKFINELLKNVVVSPAEIKSEGIKYFDKKDDIGTSEKLTKEIMAFLKGRKQPRKSEETGESE